MQAIRCPNCTTLVGKFILKGNERITLIGDAKPDTAKEIVWLKDPSYRPFCSKHCQTIDLGAWADGSYSIPTPFKLEDYDALDFEESE